MLKTLFIEWEETDSMFINLLHSNLFWWFNENKIGRTKSICRNGSLVHVQILIKYFVMVIVATMSFHASELISPKPLIDHNVP